MGAGRAIGKIKYDYDGLRLSETVDIRKRAVPISALPKGVELKEKLAIAGVPALSGQVLYRAETQRLYETRATVTPGGDYLLMFPVGMHYSAMRKTNTMVAMRSCDKGETWSHPYVPYDISYDQHGFISMVPNGSKRIYNFGTQPVIGLYTDENYQGENAPIGYLYSDDDGHTWEGPELISPANDHQFKGMSVTRMCETRKGTWLLGAHIGYWNAEGSKSCQYLMRSEDRGESWELLPGRRPNGWVNGRTDRLEEGRVIDVGDRALMMMRSNDGYIWKMHSMDDGKTWTKPERTPLVHPSAPPMVFKLSDGETLIAFHHNRYSEIKVVEFTEDEPLRDRGEVWFSLSADGGDTWSEPRFLFANAGYPDNGGPFWDHNCSYLDMFIDGGVMHLFVPHRWQQVLHLRIEESEILGIPPTPSLD